METRLVPKVPKQPLGLVQSKRAWNVQAQEADRCLPQTIAAAAVSGAMTSVEVGTTQRRPPRQGRATACAAARGETAASNRLSKAMIAGSAPMQNSTTCAGRSNQNRAMLSVRLQKGGANAAKPPASGGPGG